MIGETCYIVDIKRDSDAEAKGLRVGDVIIGINRFAPRRKTLWVLLYYLYTLNPSPSIQVAVKGTDGRDKEVSIRPRVATPADRLVDLNQRKELEKQNPELRLKPYKCREINADLIACKLYSFLIEPEVVDKMMKEISQYKSLILDLRGNRGGAMMTLLKMTGHFFDHNVKIGSEVRRQKTDERIAKKEQPNFGGELTILVDSLSASAAEVFARVIQIEKRGKVVGDVSAGAVMTAQSFALGEDRSGASWYSYSIYGGMEVTVGDLIMGDGQRLEGSGVVPDVLSLQTGKSLSEKSDPVLAAAASLFGAKLSPEAAGKFQFLVRVPETGDADDMN
jgi:C-terminal processing protease CtpA/Prc